ncbi:prephenate dehydratase [Halolamina pelagica]|uniref:Prephenate dehydratase n=1 Tax=Halolamina pelagica TaxID=699431 RepID=A0A0P7H874_9EURY|nr:prephenate dehydratase [Halolamina pelagica]
MHVVTLGPAGTYSHRAAQSIADEGAVSFRESVTEIVAAVADGEFERGVVPVENSIEGSVDESLDALADREVSVVQEIVSPIRHALLAREPEFDTVASHPQALAQCREYLTENYPDVAQEAVASTARGVERARKDPSVAAIGHPANAGSPGQADDDAHPLQRIAENIQDRDSNATRFLVVAPRASARRPAGKPASSSTPARTTPASCSNCWRRSRTGTSTSPGSSRGRAAAASATTASTSTSRRACTRPALRRRWRRSKRSVPTVGSADSAPTTPTTSSSSGLPGRSRFPWR